VISAGASFVAGEKVIRQIEKVRFALSQMPGVAHPQSGISRKPRLDVDGQQRPTIAVVAGLLLFRSRVGLNGLVQIVDRCVRR
jgi:hypothetical protein